MPFIYEGNKKWFNVEPGGTPFLKYESSALILDQSEAGQGPTLWQWIIQLCVRPFSESGFSGAAANAAVMVHFQDFIALFLPRRTSRESSRSSK